jgi:hypothetical protein
VSATSRTDLEQLSTEELRKRAFHLAERRVDVHFFWDLIKHFPSASELNSEDGSLGSVSDSITELVELGRNLMGKDLGDREPLLRARFIDYLGKGDD